MPKFYNQNGSASDKPKNLRETQKLLADFKVKDMEINKIISRLVEEEKRVLERLRKK